MSSEPNEGSLQGGEPPFSSIQIGTQSLALLGLFAALLVIFAAILGRTLAVGLPFHLLPFAIATVILIGSAIRLATLTIRGDAEGVEWYFTGRIFSKRLGFDEIQSCEPWRGHGYRPGAASGSGERRWIVSSSSAVEIYSRGIRYVVGSSDPDAVCAEIARRMHGGTCVAPHRIPP